MKKISLSILSIAIAASLMGTASVSLAQTAADTDFQSALNQLRQARQAFKDAKSQEVKELQEAVAEKVKARRDQIEKRREETAKRREEQRKTVLNRLIDIQIKHFNRTNDRIQKMPNITDELKSQLQAKVDAAIQKLNEEKAKVQDTSGETEIKALAKEVRDLFKAHRELVKEIVDAIHASMADYAADKAEERANSIKAKIEGLKNEGKNTDELSAELENAEKNIADAREKIGRKAFREANEDLKGAYQLFRGIADKAKGM